MAEQNFVKGLGQRLNEKFDTIIMREIKREYDKQNIREMQQVAHTELFGKTTWSLPSHIIEFLSTSINIIDGIKIKL